MPAIDKSYILRLYALHDRMATEINSLAGELLFGGDADKIVASVDHLDALAEEMESVFAEVLTDEERDVPTDEEAIDMVDEMTRKDGEQ